MLGRKPRAPDDRKVIRAEGFELVDRNGKTRAGLVLEPDGTVLLAFLDRGGKFRAMLGVDADGMPTVVLGDRNGNARAGVVVRALEAPGDRDAAEALPLDLRGTPFQREVWDALRRVPAGSSATYAAADGPPAEAHHGSQFGSFQISQVWTPLGA